MQRFARGAAAILAATIASVVVAASVTGCADGAAVRRGEPRSDARSRRATEMAPPREGPLVSQPKPRPKPFGMFRYPPSPDDGLPLTATRIDLRDLEAAQATGTVVLLALTGGRRRYSDARGCFDLAAWKATLDRADAQAVEAGIASGVVAGLYAIDEPHDWKVDGAFCGPTHAELAEACRYARERWPELGCGYNVDPAWLDRGRAGVDLSSLTFVLTQYSLRRGDVDAWIAAQTEAAAWFPGDLWLSANVRQPAMTPAQVRDVGDALCRSEAVGVLMWHYDAALVDTPGMRDALRDVARACGHASGPTRGSDAR